MPSPAPVNNELHRVVGLPGAVLVGLGSILGTGVFVSLGVAAGIAGNALLLAVVISAFVAACNAMSSAQLSAAHPVSGGTYEFGYRLLTPSLGFTAGWMFLVAKSFSAATAALGFSGYLLRALAVDPAPWRVPVAIGAVALFTALVVSGVRRSALANTVIVSLTLVALGVFVFTGFRDAAGRANVAFTPFFAPGDASDARPAFARVLEASALMFVAYAGYARITTMGEEIRDPRRVIPLAILGTLVIALAIYSLVAFVSLGAFGATNLFEATREAAAPLEASARHTDGPIIARIVAIGAITAMLGVLLNLILGLSRVALAMGRRSDLPPALARVSGKGSPTVAVVCVGVGVGALALLGDVRLTWSFSAFTVLVYYAITNLAAIRLAREDRMYPAWIAWAGLAACVSLAFFVEVRVWAIGLGIIAAGLAIRAICRAALARA